MATNPLPSISNRQAWAESKLTQWLAWIDRRDQMERDGQSLAGLCMSKDKALRDIEKLRHIITEETHKRTERNP